MKSPLILAITMLFLAAPASAGWGDWWWNWWSNRDGSGETDSPAPPPPTEEEVEAMNTEIVESAANDGVEVDPEAMKDYARRLATTLNTLSPEQRDRVLSE